jgi:hypothetical protein
MHITPRQLLTSGTAAAAVAGALLLGAEDVGLAPFARAHSVDASALWMSGSAPMHHRSTLPRRAPADAVRPTHSR